MLSLRKLHVFLTTINSTRHMSVYAPIYVEPVFKKQKQIEIAQTEEAIKLAHAPIKPARNNDSCSVFHDDIISKFTNYIMRKGKKTLARDLLEKSFEMIKRIQLERYNLAESSEKDKIETNPKVILHTAISNCRPLLHLTPIKRGGVKYQVPVPLTEKRSMFLAMKWLVEAAKEKERTVHFPDRLAWELIDASLGQGKVIKKKNDLHRQCEANRAYAHYRWS